MTIIKGFASNKNSWTDYFHFFRLDSASVAKEYLSVFRTKWSRTSFVQPAIRRIGWTSSNLPDGELDRLHPTRLMAIWIHLVQLASGKLDRPRPTRHQASWIRRVGSGDLDRPHHALSSYSPDLCSSSLGQTVSCFISIGVTVETLR